MAAEILSFEKNESKNAYYTTFVSDGNPVTIQIKNKGGMVTVFANIEGMKPVILYPNVRDNNDAPDSIFRVAGIVAGVEITIRSATEVLEAKMIKEE